MAPKSIYIFSATHWDREWCQPFQGFRNRLVSMMNDLIDFLETNPDFNVFHLDGQTVMLEDYLEIEPQNRGRLAKLIADERIRIGPWYVMPDELLLSGESLVRNLLHGHRIAKAWGVEAWKYGYVCDMFGHIAQMPQIFHGFGIRYALLGRGTNEQTCPAHFRWRSPDGSESLTFKLPDHGGYGDFFYQVTMKAFAGLSHDESADVFHAASSIDPAQADVGKIPALLKDFINYESGRSPIPVVLLMDGIDHQHVRKDTVHYVSEIASLFPESEVKHASLVEMGQELEAYREQLPVKTGEIYEPAIDKVPYNHVIRHTMSSRYPQKQANDRCQALLEKWAEPLAAIAGLQDHGIQRSYIDLAYRYLLLNHAHDSICGCSIDQVHKDMDYRFDQSRLLAENVIDDFLAFDQASDPADRTGHDRALVLWNPLPFPRDEVVTIDIDFHPGYPRQYAEPFGYEHINSFRIFDAQGCEIPYGLCAMKRQTVKKKYNKSGADNVDRFTVSFRAKLPPMGKSVYRVVPFERPSRYVEKLSRRELEMENEYLRVTIQEQGTLRLVDKRTGRTLDRLLGYVDDGEIGDGWNHVRPVNDRAVSSAGSHCIIDLVENGPARTVYRIAHELFVPEGVLDTPQGKRRSDRTVPLRIVSRVGLSAGAAHVDVHTTIDNCARDHRLRLQIPTGSPGADYFANQAFAFVERHTGLDASTQHWREIDTPEKQMSGIVGRRGPDGSGLAFVAPFGLHECAADDDADGTLRVTLFRSFGRTAFTDGEEGGQLIGALDFHYALVPLLPETTPAALARLQDALQAPPRARSYRLADGAALPSSISFFEVRSAHAVMTILKKPENGSSEHIVVRLCNLSGERDVAALHCFRSIADAEAVAMNEEPLTNPSDRLSILDGVLQATLHPWEVRTLRLKIRE